MGTRTYISSIILPVLMCGAAFGQAAGSPPAFEVASIKAIGPGTGEGRRRENIQVAPGNLTMTNVSLKSAIRWAYHVFDYQVSGPAWLANERFDIVAKASGPTPEEQMRVMLQTMLGERFKLKVHHLTKEQQVYALVVAKNGPKFHESQDNGESQIEPNQKEMKITIRRTPVSQLLEMLTNIAQLPVVDLTGLTGRYDITIDAAKYVLDRNANEPIDPLGLIMRGLEEELGLKLESRKMAVDLVIVDEAEKIPAEN